MKRKHNIVNTEYKRLFDNLKKHESEKFSVKLAMMHLISRLIHRHKLQIIPFYTYI